MIENFNGLRINSRIINKKRFKSGEKTRLFNDDEKYN
jgi:hypothetical protein